MSDDILHTGRADIHHPKGPLTGQAAQQPLSRDDELRVVAEKLTTPAEFWEFCTVEQAARAAVEALDLHARDARVRADERRRTLDEALDLIAQHAVGVSARDPFLADTLDSEQLTFGQVRAALVAAYWHEPAPAESVGERRVAPSVRPDTDRTPDVGTPGLPERLGDLADGLSDEERQAFVAGSVPSLPEETPDVQ